MLEGYVLKDLYFWGYIETILIAKDWLKLFNFILLIEISKIMIRITDISPLMLSNQQLPCKLECAASNGNRYPPYPQVMATAISQ